MNEYGQVILMLAIFIPVYYFFLIRPAQKKKKDSRKMRDSLKPGDSVVTIGGFVGKIVTVKDEYVIFECGSDRTRLKILRSAIGSVESAEEEN